MSAEAIILLTTGLIAIFGALIAATATIVIYFKDSLSKNNKAIYEAIKEVSATIKEVSVTIINKLEYHEQHDDIRFAQIADRNNASFKEQSDRIWNIELRNAAKDGTLPHEYKKN